MTREIDPLRPQKPGGMGRGTAIAIGVHVVLIGALAFGVNWRASEPEGMVAELWSATPQAAAPRAVEPPPPPPPAPAPAPEPPKPKVEEPPKPDPQIAIEQERKEREAREKAQREKEEREKAERDKQERQEREKAEREKQRLEKERLERLEKERVEKERREEQARERRLAELTEKARKEQMERMQGLMGATGGPESKGTAQRSAGPSAGYAGKVRAAIYPNITLLNTVVGNPTAVVEVRASPDGTIQSRRLVKSSGNPQWDDAVLAAIDRTRVLPRDTDGRVPSPMEILFRPQEQ